MTERKQGDEPDSFDLPDIPIREHPFWEDLPERPMERPISPTPTKPIRIERIPEPMKHHIKRDGRK